MTEASLSRPWARLIPSLQEIHFDDAMLMVNDLTEVLVHAKGLRVLKLNKIVLQGVPEHFTACESAFYQNFALTEFELEGCLAAVKGVSLQGFETAGKKVASTGPIQRMMHRAMGAKSA